METVAMVVLVSLAAYGAVEVVLDVLIYRQLRQWGVARLGPLMIHVVRDVSEADEAGA